MHGPLSGKVFVFTGEPLHNAPQQGSGAGARAWSRDFGDGVAQGDNARLGVRSGSKMTKARQLGIEILDEQQFLSLIGQGT